MLLQFSVENFLSFNEEQIFSMIAAADDKRHPTHLVEGEDGKGGTVLRAAAIYGPNASGKSNLVSALRFAQSLITERAQSNHSLRVRPFRLSETASKRPTKFEFVIRSQDVLYNYGFRLNAKTVMEEWLYATFNKQEVVLFERTTTADGKVEVEAGPQLRGRTKEQAQFLKFITQGMQPNQLFLTEASEHNVALVEPLMDWFQDILVLIPAEARFPSLEARAHKDKEFIQFISNVIRAAGTGIETVETEEIPVDMDRLLAELSIEEREDFRSHLNDTASDEVVVIQTSSGRRYLLKPGENGGVIRIRLMMQHQGNKGRSVTFNMDEESDGTQRFIHLLPALFMLKNQPEKTVVIDELDRRFHTHLSRMFLQTALNCDKDHTRSQLIFTTHDTNLLDLDLLRRDEIWFVEKDAQGQSNLYSLAEFKTRPDLKIEKGYLNGRFGAIPFISDIRHLGWMPETELKATDIEAEKEAMVA